MKIIFNIKAFYALILLLVLLSAGIAGCKKNFTGEVEDESKNRSFLPSGLSISTVRDTVKFKWKAPIYAQAKQPYTLQLSTDSLFGTVDITVKVDSVSAFLVDPEVKLNTPYFTRIKVDEFKGRAASNFLYGTRSFRLTGQQYIRVVRDFEISETTLLLHWFINDQTTSLSSIVLTPLVGSPVTVSLSPGDISAGEKLISGLTPGTRYTVQLLSGAKSKGIINVTTRQAVNYTTMLSSGANLTAAIAAAASGDIIGLNPGTYSLTGSVPVNNKRISIRSVSNDPANTRLLLREFNLIGDSAGITLAGLDINGNYSGTSYGANPIQLLGNATTTGAAANFGDIRIDNCNIHDFTRCIIRGNYASAADVHKMGAIVINNCRIYNFDQTNVQGYYMFSLEKLQFASLNLTKSTLYNIGAGMVNMGTVLSATSGNLPVITFDYNTFNNFSGNAKYPFIDANSNKIIFNFNNSIVANTPISGAVNAAALRATNTQNILSFSNNNYFKLNVTPGGGALSLAGLLQNNNLKIDLGWNAATTTFLLVPSLLNNAVFSASSNGSTIGDPRWAY